jgi:hypothetical protein
MKTGVCAAVASAAVVVAAGPSTAAPVNACGLFAAAVSGNHYWAANLTKHVYVANGSGSRCEWTSIPPAGSVTPAFALVLTFFSNGTTALAHQNIAFLQRKGDVLQNTGADEAFATQMHEAGGTSTRVAWRRGRYWGFLSVAGPKLVGDRDDARDLLKAFIARLPRA